MDVHRGGGSNAKRRNGLRRRESRTTTIISSSLPSSSHRRSYDSSRPPIDSGSRNGSLVPRFVSAPSVLRVPSSLDDETSRRRSSISAEYNPPTKMTRTATLLSYSSAMASLIILLVLFGRACHSFFVETVVVETTLRRGVDMDNHGRKVQHNWGYYQSSGKFVQTIPPRLRGRYNDEMRIASRRHDSNRNHRRSNKRNVSNRPEREEAKERSAYYPGEEDATPDFFYAGRRFAAINPNKEQRPGDNDEADSIDAYSYGTLPLLMGDCNPFVISVWTYLSPHHSRYENISAEDTGARVLLSTKIANANGGCRSEVFGPTSSVGWILYALPRHGDGMQTEYYESYAINLEYGTADEATCRTLSGGGMAPPLKVGEWHHIVLFVTEINNNNNNAGREKIRLYIDGELAGTEEFVTHRLCHDGADGSMAVGRLVLDTTAEAVPQFDLNGRVGMLSYWETGGPEVLTEQSQRMDVSTTRNEEHVVRSMNRARFDVGAIKELSLQGLTVREPSLLFTFDGHNEKGKPKHKDSNTDETAEAKKDPTIIREVMLGNHGKISILFPFEKGDMDQGDDRPFQLLGGNRYPEYKDGTHVPPRRSKTESAQLNEIAHKRSVKVKEAMEHLWKGYKTYAWGKDELLPLSNGGQDNWGGMGTTMLDSLSTLWLMGMEDEFWDARDWIKRYLDFNNVRKAVSVFETTIRNLGSLLSAYDLSGDKTFLAKAEDLGTRLLKAFSTPRGVPYSEVELFDGGRAFNTNWHSNSAVLSEIGTLQLEFRYLAHATGKTEFATVAMRALDELLKLETETGLYPTFIHNTKGFLSFANNDISVGAMGDSFYEYLLKIWLQGGKTETVYRQKYDKAIKGIIGNLICKKNGLTYVAELFDGKLRHKMDHLSCYLGGNMALGAYTHPDGLESKEAQMQLITGKQLAYTCYQMCARGKYGLSPEYVQFSGAKRKDDFSPASDAPYYILRPEASETFFILYHLTKDDTYRQWGWEVFRAIEEYCRTDSGYAALKDVNSGQQNNRMESFSPPRL